MAKIHLHVRTVRGSGRTLSLSRSDCEVTGILEPHPMAECDPPPSRRLQQADPYPAHRPPQTGMCSNGPIAARQGLTR